MFLVSNFPSRRRSRKSPQTPLRAPIRLPPGGGSAVRRWRSPRALHFRTTSPLSTISLCRGTMHFFLCTKEKSSKKEVCEPAVRPPRRAGYHPRKFRPHLTHKFSMQMGCHRGISDAPNHRFFPTECVRQTPSLITRPAPRAPYGHRRGLCVVISVRAQSPFPHLPERSDR